MNSNEFKEKVQKLVSEKGKDVKTFSAIKQEATKELYEDSIEVIQNRIVAFLELRNNLEESMIYLVDSICVGSPVNLGLFAIIKKDLESKIAHSLIDSGFYVQSLSLSPRFNEYPPRLHCDILVSFDEILPSIGGM